MKPGDYIVCNMGDTITMAKFKQVDPHTRYQGDVVYLVMTKRGSEIIDDAIMLYEIYHSYPADQFDSIDDAVAWFGTLHKLNQIGLMYHDRKGWGIEGIPGAEWVPVSLSPRYNGVGLRLGSDKLTIKYDE